MSTLIRPPFLCGLLVPRPPYRSRIEKPLPGINHAFTCGPPGKRKFDFCYQPSSHYGDYLRTRTPWLGKLEPVQSDWLNLYPALYLASYYECHTQLTLRSYASPTESTRDCAAHRLPYPGNLHQLSRGDSFGSVRGCHGSTLDHFGSGGVLSIPPTSIA